MAKTSSRSTFRRVVVDFTRYGLNDATKILHATEREFEANLVDEEHPDYWDGHEGEIVALDMTNAAVIKDNYRQ